MLQVDDKFIFVSLGTIKKAIHEETIKTIIQSLSKREQTLSDHFLLLLDANAVAGMEHLKACIHYAIIAFKQQLNLAKSLSAEILLYLSGYRQISRAIQQIGVSPNTRKLLLLQITSKEKEFQYLHLGDFLGEYQVELIEFEESINQFTILDEEKVKSILQIGEEEIAVLEDEFISREEILTKLAIEKSALLNIQK